MPEVRTNNRSKHLPSTISLEDQSGEEINV